MKYYIVALFDEDSYESLNPIQKKVSKKFKAHRNSPLAHITLNVLENPNMEKLNTVMEKNLKPYKKFKVQACNDITISETLKNVNLKIENLGYIKKIERSISDSLELYGLNSKSFSDENFGISLANVNYINKDKNGQLPTASLDQIVKNSSNMTFKISKFEIWKQNNNRKEICVKSYPLRLF
ncbi:hypothetical protein ACTNDG_06985 [Clostridium sp. HCP1S3_B4]|uniref:hypothetical protein n=1 Tax=unclassified Clostridium TaxID=2614128 RepID=UPI002A7E0E4E|nr:hypothetical protein [Clostridiales bacterium]MDY2729755.1 hypothetical protein [Clostridium sp.]